MNLDPPFGTEAPIDWHGLPQIQGQPARQEQSSEHNAGWSPALFVADSQRSPGQNTDAQTTGFLSQSRFDVNGNIPALDTGNAASGEYNPLQNPPISSVWPPSLGPSATWPLDLNATSFHAASSQHNAAFQVGTMFQLSNFPHHVLYHATEAAAPSSASLTARAHPVGMFDQYRVQGEPEANPEDNYTYGTLQGTGNTANLPPPLRPIKPKPMPRCDVATPDGTKQQKAQVTPLATAHTLPKLIRPGKRCMEVDLNRATSLKRKRSFRPYNKRVWVPEEHYYNCFQGSFPSRPYPEAEMSRRQRSAKVCFRCQDQKLKCDGSFPCSKCREVARRGRVKYELPCIEADLHALNPFFDLLEHRWEGIDSVSEMNRFMHALPFEPSIMIQDDSIPPHSISVIIAREASELPSLMYPIPPTVARRIISDFSYFTSTGLPASVDRFCPPYRSRRPKASRDDRIRRRTLPEHGFFHTHPELEAIFTLLTITFHGETILGQRLSLPPHEIHALRFYWVAKALGLSANVLKKWKACPRDVTADQKVRLGLMLIALLIVTEYRETYILDSLRRKFEEHCVGSSETTGGHLTSIVGYLCRGMTTMKHLRQCLRHFLRRLFGGGNVPHEFWEAAVSIGYSSGSEPAIPKLRTTIYDDMDGWRIRQGLSKRLDTYLRNSMPTPVPPRYGVTRDEFERRVDYLGCKDVRIGSLHMRDRGLDESPVASHGLLPRQLSEDELRVFAEGITKKRDTTFKRAATDGFQVSGDKTSDTVLKYLFLKWLEG